MLLGKRPRPPLKKTPSMTEITFDLNPNDDQMVVINSQPSDPHNPFNELKSYQNYTGYNNNNNNHMFSPRTTYRRNSADFVDTAHFLRSCGFCNRRLVPSRDIYMYRGDTAFCSLECRQHQMNQDERVEKCSMASKKGVSAVVSSSSSAAAAAGKGETVVAV